MAKLERLWLVGLAMVMLGSGGLAFAWAPGQHASPDSAIYLDGARQIAAGHGYVTARITRERLEPAPISAWPPAFSLLLAGGLKLGLSGGQAAAWVLWLSFVAFGAFAFLLMLLVSERRWWPLAALLSLPILLHPGTLRGLDSILTDLPFAACCGGLLCLAVHLTRREDPSPRAVFVLGLLAGGVVLVRWAGLYWVVPVGLGLLAAIAPRLGFPAAIRRGAAFGLGLGAVLLPWFARNLVRTGALAGIRRAAPSNPFAAAGDAAEGILSMLASVGNVPPALIALALAATAVGLFVTRAWRDGAVLVLLAVALGYPALMVASWALAPFDPLSRGRFWLPLWPVGAALFVAVLARCEGRRGLQLGIALLGLGVVVPATVSFSDAYLRRLPTARRATGLASPVWASSAPVRFLADAAQDCTVVASEPRIHLIHNTLPVIYTLPTEREQLSPLLERGQPLCIVYMLERSSGSAEKRRGDHLALIQELAAEGRVRRVAADRVGEVWLAESPERWQP